MTTLTKSIIALVGAVVIGGFIWGAYQYPKLVAAGSPAGTTFNSAKVAAVNISPQSVTSSSSALYNGDASDRIVTDAFVSCSGLTNMFGTDSAGLATYRWGAATSSTAAPSPSIVGNLLSAMNITVATSSDNGYTATTTYTSAFSRRWNAGSYMVFQSNGTSTSATCQAGVHYLAL